MSYAILHTTRHSYQGLKNIILCLVLALMATACDNRQPEQAKALRIAHGHWPGFDIAHYGLLEGYFKKRGVEVELIRMDNQFDATRQMARGRVDAAFTSVNDIFMNSEITDSHQVILITNVSNGSDGIVAQPGIESMKDLAGKSVSAKYDTVNETILLEALDHHGVDPTSVKIKDISNESAIQKFIAGELDATVIWEPELSRAAKETGGSVIFRTSELQSLVIDCLVTDQSVINKRREDLQRFALAWLDIMNSVENAPDKVFKGVAQAIKQKPDAFANDYKGLRKGDQTLNQRLLVNGKLSQDVIKLRSLLSITHPKLPARPNAINPSIMKFAIDQWKPLP